MTLTAVLTASEEGGFIAFNPETGSTSQGESISEALANLQEATDLYLEEFPLATALPTWVTTFEVSSAQTTAN
jgi:predicted RNase H-like HicB family nuclease